MRRMSIPRGVSKNLFRRSGSRTHWRNVAAAPMRGGIRL